MSGPNFPRILAVEGRLMMRLFVTLFVRVWRHALLEILVGVLLGAPHAADGWINAEQELCWAI